MIGNFLCYACTVNPTILVTLNSITTEQAKIIEATAKAVTDMINYASMHSEAITRYHVIGMILHTHSNASFLSEPGAKSRSGGCHYLSTASADPNKAPLKQPPLNRPVHVKCTTMINVLASAMEAELGALFVNCQSDTATCMAFI